MNQSKMSSVECSFKTLTAPHLGELLQSQNSLTFKLLKTVGDFSQSLATLHDRFGHEIQMLVETFRKRNGELRKERLNCPNSLFQIWELFLQQVEVNSQQHGDISRDLGQTLGNGLIERVFHRKIQSKKIFSHKERIEAILLKSNELLGKCYEDYCQAYAMALKDPAQYVNEYIASHNVYVHQLQATNGMVHAYQTKTLPRLLEELEECHLETSSNITNSILGSSELIAEKSSEQVTGYQNLAGACKQANHRQDMALFVKVVASTSPPPPQQQDHQDQQETAGGGHSLERNSIRYHQFQAANWQQSNQLESLSQIDPKNLQIVPTFKNEIAPDYSQPPDQQQPKLEMDRESLEEKIDKFEERIESLTKLLVRSSESRLHNKVNELQEELSQRKFDLFVAQIHLSAVRSQLQLFEYNFRPMAQSGSQLPLGPIEHSQLGAGNATDDQRQDQNHHGSPNGCGGAVGGAGAGSAQYGHFGGHRRSPQSGGSSSSANVMAPLGYRSKWIKAFKSLKETPQQQQQQVQQQQQQQQQQLQKFSDGDFQSNDLLAQSATGRAQQQSGSGSASGHLENQHFFQEYTFKKIASCDVCKDFLRGHMRQGVKCKLCKISCHNDCQTKAHGTIKCQQPKIKLLRRQKSAGELEVNLNSDADQNATDQNERIFSSKPDSIYSLIRQVLDAKKRGQHHAPTSLHPSNANNDDHNSLRPHFNLAAGGSGGGLAQSHMMNLSTGNLALANQNGKSVSTSALQHRPESSVDRWSVVMDLLAQSRHKKDANSADDGAGLNSTNSGKRHSKQLDKFKLAARSVGKQQRHHVAGGQQPGSTMQPGTEQQDHQHQSVTQTASMGPSIANETHMTNALGYQQKYDSSGVANANSRVQQGRGLIGGNQLEAPLNANQPQQLLVHHTKSLPVGQLPQKVPLGAGNNPQQQQQIYDGPSAIGINSGLGHHPLQMQNYAEGSLAGPTMSNPIPMTQPQQQQQSVPIDRQPYQLLDLGNLQQQIQSTSAPHSPQRKRFNLRMKSFSLDSPESPIVVGAGMYPTGQPMSGSQANSAGLGNPQHHHHHQQYQGQQESPHRHQAQKHTHNQFDGYPSEGQQQLVRASSSSAERILQSGATHQRRISGSQPVAANANYQQTRSYATNQQQQQQSSANFYYQSSSSGGNKSNNYAGHQAGTSVAATSTKAAGQHESGYLGPSFYAPNELLDRRLFSSSGDNQLTHHNQSTLRPGQQQQLPDGATGTAGRHQQQHRHSYHNPMSTAAAYNYQDTARLMRTGGEVRDPFMAGDMATTIATSRHCASSSALNIHHIPSSTGAISASTGPPTTTAPVKATQGPTKAKQLGSGATLNNIVGNNHHQQDRAPNGGGASVGPLDQQDHHANGLNDSNTANSNHTSLNNSNNNGAGNSASTNSGNAPSNDYYDLDVDQHKQQQNQSQQSSVATVVGGGGVDPAVGPTLSMPPLSSASSIAPAGDTFVVLYDYVAQRGDEIQLAAGQLIQVLDTSERDWWKVRALDGSNRIGYFPSSYLAQLYQNERPLQVAQTIQVSNGETCDKLLRGQIVIHTGKQLNSFVTIRTIRNNASPNDAPQALVNYIQCPEKYLLEVMESH